MSFFDKTDYEKQKKAEQAIDQLRKRFGRDVIMRASFLPSVNMENHSIDHMGGGISREKRSVDYSKEDII
jgi:DNA polymerase-4